MMWAAILLVLALVCVEGAAQAPRDRAPGTYSHVDVPIDIEITKGASPAAPYVMVLTNRGDGRIVAFSLASYLLEDPLQSRNTLDMRDVPNFGPGRQFVMPMPRPFDPARMHFGTVYAVYDDGRAVGEFAAIEQVRAMNRLRLAQWREIAAAIDGTLAEPTAENVRALVASLETRRKATRDAALGVTADAYSAVLKGLRTVLAGRLDTAVLRTALQEHLQHVREEIALDQRNPLR